jgi:putative nucleotidyltransferase with HDIG domain
MWAHCRRVAALGQALAHHLFLPTEQKDLLKAAALLHHVSYDLVSGSSLRKLLSDVLPDAPEVIASLLPTEVSAVLAAIEDPGGGDHGLRQLADIVRLCDAYDQEYEAATFELRSVENILWDMRGGVESGLWSEAVFDAMEEISQVQEFGGPQSWPVPAFPGAVARIVGLLGDPMASVERIAEAAGQDPSVAGRLVQLANSALYPSRNPVSTLTAAILRVGMRQAQKVTLSFAMRSVLADRGLASLWTHSLEVAEFAEQAASLGGRCDPEEAYLCGLMHDVGRLVTARLRLYDAARIEGLQKGGCPPVYAESLLLRTHHGILSARLTEYWRLPGKLNEGIAAHHHPESTESRLAHTLYVAEYLAGGEEDIPSQARLTIALAGAGLALADLGRAKVSPVVGWMAAA